MDTARDLFPVCATRSVITIIWSSFAVILASTWASVHPDVPLKPSLNKEPSKTEFTIDTSTFWSSRAILFIIAVLWPERCVAMALEQWQQAKVVRSRYKDMKKPSKSDTEASAGQQNNIASTSSEQRPTVNHAHSFFLVMNGFQFVHDRQLKVLTVDDSQNHADQWHNIPKEQISGRSRRDPLSKSLIIIQLIWFITQLIARRAQRLAVAHVEVMALAYVLTCGVFYVLWWHKPYNVRLPIIVGPPRIPSNQSSHQKNQSFFLPETLRGQIALFLGSGLFGSTHLLAWKFAFPTRVEHIVWISCSLVSAVGFLPGFLLLKHSRGETLTPLAPITMMICLSVHITCRLTLFVLCFLLLRGLPETALHSISWSSFIPHI